MVTCDVYRCPNTAEVHVLLSCSTCGRDTFEVCRRCLSSSLSRHLGCTECWAVLHHVADHPLEPQCRHPQSRWVDDRCEIDGLEVPDWIDELVGVPA